MNVRSLVRELHAMRGAPVRVSPCWPDFFARRDTRTRVREAQEAFDDAAEQQHDPRDLGETQAYVIGVAYRLAQVVYAAHRAALVFGIDLDACVAALHRAEVTRGEPDVHGALFRARG